MFKSAVLKYESFRNLWLGQSISQFGDACYFVVFLYTVDKITHSPAMVGYMGAVETLPFFIFGPYAGVLTDRIDRRWIMLASDILSVILLLILGTSALFTTEPPLWLLFVSAFSLSTVNAFFMPARAAVIPNLVPQDKLVEANSLSSAVQSIAPVLGTALAAALAAIIEVINPRYYFPIAIYVNALTFAGSAYFISKLPQLLPLHVKEKGITALTDAIEGFKYLWSNRVLRLMVTMEFFSYLLLAPFAPIYVTTNREWFGGRPDVFALLESTYGIAMMIGSFVVMRLKLHSVSKPYLFGGLLVGTAIIGLAFSKFLPLFILMNIIAGFPFPFTQIPLNSYIQAHTPNHYLGRVNSALVMVTWGVLPIGMAAAGLLVTQFGLVNMYLIMGVGMCCTMLPGILSKDFRRATITPKEVTESKSLLPGL